jgi:hypothetical protein
MNNEDARKMSYLLSGACRILEIKGVDSAFQYLRGLESFFAFYKNGFVLNTANMYGGYRDGILAARNLFGNRG